MNSPPLAICTWCKAVSARSGQRCRRQATGSAFTLRATLRRRRTLSGSWVIDRGGSTRGTVLGGNTTTTGDNNIDGFPSQKWLYSGDERYPAQGTQVNGAVGYGADVALTQDSLAAGSIIDVGSILVKTLWSRHHLLAGVAAATHAHVQRGKTLTGSHVTDR
jgi:hypothetical protein